MLLDIKKRELMRKEVEQQLDIVDDGKQIKLAKDLLETLLFEEYVLDQQKCIKVKIPVWSGNFLRKIDLSEVDFENVTWNFSNEECQDCFSIYVDDGSCVEHYRVDSDFVDSINEVLDKYRSREYLVDFSGTNANIDLSKCYEYKYGNHLNIDCCNLGGIDLSASNIYVTNPTFIYNSNLSNTNLNLSKHDCLLYCYKSSLEGVFIGDYAISADGYFDDASEEFSGCNLNDTGVTICLNPDTVCKMDAYEFMNTLLNSWRGCKIDVEGTKDKGNRIGETEKSCPKK